MMNWTEIVGWCGSAALIGINIPQIVLIIRRKSAADVSALSYFFYALVAMCFTIRGIAIREWIFAAPNIFSIFSASTVLFLKWKYRLRISYSAPKFDLEYLEERDREDALLGKIKNRIEAASSSGQDNRPSIC